MKAEIKGNNLVITIPCNTTNPPASKGGTGPSLIVASTQGNTVTDVIVNGKPLTIGLNAYIKKD